MDIARKLHLSDNQFGFFCGCCAAFIYGFTAVISKIGYSIGLNSYSLCFGRYFWGFFLYGIVIIVTHGSFRVNLKEFLYIMLVGLTGVGTVLTAYVGYNYLPAGISTLLGMSQTIFILLIEIILGLEKSRMYKWGVMIMAFCGVFIIVYSPDGMSGISLTGVAIALTAAFIGAVQTLVFNGKAIRHLTVSTIYFYEVLFPIFTVPFFAKFVMHQNPFPATIGQFAFCGVFSFLNFILGLLLFSWAIRLIGPGNASLITLTEPLISCIGGALIFHEKITGKIVVGGIILIASVLVKRIFENKEQMKKIQEKLDAEIHEEIEEELEEAFSTLPESDE